jgi:hypothetical protein
VPTDIHYSWPEDGIQRSTIGETGDRVFGNIIVELSRFCGCPVLGIIEKPHTTY